MLNTLNPLTEQSNAKLLSLRFYLTCTHININYDQSKMNNRVYCRYCGGISMISISTQHLILFAQILAKKLKLIEHYC